MAKAFDKDRWLEEKQQRLDEAKAALEHGLKALVTGDDWKRTLQAMAHLGALSVLRYSFRNQILIQLAFPGTTQAATFKRWEAFGRHVRKGEKATALLRPVFRRRDEDTDGEDSSKIVGFRSLSIFALSQTEGPELPKISLPDMVGEEVFADSVEKLREAALAIPQQPVANLILRPRELGDRPGIYGWFVPATKDIVVIAEGPRSQQFATLCHELAHALLHPAGEHHSRREAEVEAESTAFVVCQALGLDTGAFSFPYVATWADSHDPLKAVAASGQRIATAALRILDALVPEARGELEAAA